MSIGKNLERVMLVKKLSQADVARLTSISPSIISDLITGKKHGLSTITLKKFADGLDITIDDLLTDAPRPEPQTYTEIIDELIELGVTEEHLRQVLNILRAIKFS